MSLMRKPLLIIFIILPLLIFGILILKNHSTTPQKPKAEDFSPTPIGINNSIEVDGFTVSWFEIDNIDNLKLIPNFSEKLSSKEVIQKNNCKLLSNGPFYATNENGNQDRKSTRLNSSHQIISYAVFCLKKKKERAVRQINRPNCRSVN